MAQEILTTFTNDVAGVTLVPSELNGDFKITIGEKRIFDRKTFGGFLEITVLKQLIRDEVNPGKSLGHSDTKPHHTDSV